MRANERPRCTSRQPVGRGDAFVTSRTGDVISVTDVSLVVLVQKTLLNKITKCLDIRRMSWLVTYRDGNGMPARRWSPIRVLTGPDVG